MRFLWPLCTKSFSLLSLSDFCFSLRRESSLEHLSCFFSPSNVRRILSAGRTSWLPARRFGRMISRGSLGSFSSPSTSICRQHGVGPQSSARHPSSHFKVLIKPAVSTPVLSRRKASSVLVNAGSPFQLFNRGPFPALRVPASRSVSHSLDPSKIQSTVAHSEGKSIISSFSLFFARPERRLSSSPPPRRGRLTEYYPLHCASAPISARREVLSWGRVSRHVREPRCLTLIHSLACVELAIYIGPLPSQSNLPCFRLDSWARKEIDGLPARLLDACWKKKTWLSHSRSQTSIHPSTTPVPPPPILSPSFSASCGCSLRRRRRIAFFLLTDPLFLPPSLLSHPLPPLLSPKMVGGDAEGRIHRVYWRFTPPPPLVRRPRRRRCGRQRR